MNPLPPGVSELPVPECARAARVFLADLGALPPPEALVVDLEGGERVRAAAFLVAHARDSFIRRRWLRRTLVSGAHGVALAAVRIESDRLGRPSIASPDPLRALSLSTSSAGRYALVAWCRAGPIGVDIARIDAAQATGDAARLFMTAREHESWLTGGQSTDLFFRIWTRKEAVLKLQGTGFATDATSIETMSACDTWTSRTADLTTGVPPGWLAALAV